MPERITLKQVALEAGVSRGTASHILSGRSAESFSAQTRQRVLAAARRLGYRPHVAARMLATGRSYLVTLWTLQPENPFFGMVIGAVQREARAQGYGLLIADISTYDLESPKSASSGWPSDGILAMDCGNWSKELLEARADRGTPIVSMGTSMVQAPDSVRLDLVPAIGEAVEHLIAQGCRRIAYVSWLPPLLQSADIGSFGTPRDAYRKAVDSAGLKPEVISVPTPNRSMTRRTLVEHVRQHGCPDGIICRNDDLAIGAYRAMCDLGVVVGQDILLVGCNGIEDTEYLSHPISTIVLPVDEMCRLGWQFLQRRIEDPACPPQQAVLRPSLEVRQSSQRLAQGK